MPTHETVVTMKRAEATTRIETVIERAIAGGTYAGLVAAVWVFGSYAAGAPSVGDVDLAVEHRSNKELDADVMKTLFYGGNPYRGLDIELRGSWRNVKIVYGAKDSLERQGGFTFVLVWRRGEPVSLVRERLDAIVLDPAAGSAPREHVFAALGGFEKQTGLQQREIVNELLANGRVTAERVELRDDKPQSERTRDWIGRHWAETNPKRRAALALAARIERERPLSHWGIGEGGDVGVIISADRTMRGFLGADKIDRAAKSLERFKETELAIVVLNASSRRPLETIEFRRGPAWELPPGAA
jgi:hypothetical protein